jgi:hypothetical protein
LLPRDQPLQVGSSAKIAIICLGKILRRRRATMLLSSISRILEWSRSDVDSKRRRLEYSASVTRKSGNARRPNDESAKKWPPIMLPCPRQKFRWHSRRLAEEALTLETQAHQAKTDTILAAQHHPLQVLRETASSRLAPSDR